MGGIIYFIATNYKLDISIFDRHHDEIYAGDVLLFGRMPHLVWFKDHPRIITFHNVWSDTKSWRCLENEEIYRYYSIKDKYILKQRPWNASVEKQWVENGGKLLDYSSCSISIGAIPSAGFICYCYFRPFYEKIALIGFTFPVNFHNGEKEKAIMLNDPKVFMLT